jgi:hypothetical protein
LPGSQLQTCAGEPMLRRAICSMYLESQFWKSFRYGLSRCHFRRSHRVGSARKRKPKCAGVHYQYSGTSYYPIPTIYWDDFIFMHDNGRPHVAEIVQHYFREVEIGQMQWAARSSDLNLIEQLWDPTDKRVRRLPNPPTTLRQLLLGLTQV